MKIQLDLNARTIKIEESVNLGEFVKAMKKLFANDEWKEFKIETNTTILNWGNPIVIDRYQVYPQPFVQPSYPFWWQSPTCICGGTSAGVTSVSGMSTVTNGDCSTVGAYTSNNGVYNLEIKNSN